VENTHTIAERDFVRLVVLDDLQSYVNLRGETELVRLMVLNHSIVIEKKLLHSLNFLASISIS
jgi:hypothetical protein